jgi:hypothetical protein
MFSVYTAVTVFMVTGGKGRCNLIYRSHSRFEDEDIELDAIQ